MYSKLCFAALRKYRLERAIKDGIAWEALCRAIQAYVPSAGLFGTYLWRWVVYFAVDYIRRDCVVRRPKQLGAPCDYLDGYDDAWSQDATCEADALDSKRRQAAMRQLIQELPERQRAAVSWQMRGYTISETAERIGVSKQRVHQINQIVEDRLNAIA